MVIENGVVESVILVGSWNGFIDYFCESQKKEDGFIPFTASPPHSHRVKFLCTKKGTQNWVLVPATGLEIFYN